MKPVYDEKKLLKLLSDDSEYAFQLLYDHYRPRIYKLSVLYLKAPGPAQEAVQDIFLKLWFSRKNLLTDQPLEPWLLTVTKNHLINQLKKVAHQWVTIDEKDLASGEDGLLSLELKESKARLAAIIDTLPAQQKQVFLLAKEDGLTYAQIGARLNLSALTVKTHMARALKSIKQQLLRNNSRFLLILL
ncbi:RNA polymerase sigma factor [Niabella aurantiaca]|uniref:RNA polymerase sigma factor n=1 Tax=Niabella aurantiaca TaxID=379900 RepID=UPI0003723D55|nr:sigma-70 family RNA polymerase sigma factor [Niabella aurantiaca]